MSFFLATMLLKLSREKACTSLMALRSFFCKSISPMGNSIAAEAIWSIMNCFPHHSDGDMVDLTFDWNYLSIVDSFLNCVRIEQLLRNWDRCQHGTKHETTTDLKSQDTIKELCCHIHQSENTSHLSKICCVIYFHEHVGCNVGRISFFSVSLPITIMH